MYLNSTTIIGNLTRDPELKSLPSGSKVVNFSVATNRVWYNEAKEKLEATEYHNIVGFGKQAETIAQYMTKGSQILIQGRLQTRSWEGQDGKKVYRTEIVLESFQFGKKSSNDTNTHNQSENVATGQIEGNTDELDQYHKELTQTDDINPEDIPF